MNSQQPFQQQSYPAINAIFGESNTTGTPSIGYQGSFSGFGVTVIAAMIVERTERGDQMFITMADRHSRHALDLGAHEFLA